MGILDDDMQRCIERQRLGFVATVCADGTPNLSPKGSLVVWDEATLVFADIRSPVTVRNLIDNPSIEINVVDPATRAGWRFRGRARVLLSGPTFERVREFYWQRAMRRPFDHVVFVDVERVQAVRSPAYDDGTTESELEARWRRYAAGLETGAKDVPSPL
jgi:predicted pyridoxine 5'-phosphate oxidase superfamily flavin-nucleotide-binding protein